MNENEHKNELELEISTFKPYLRFRIGDLVTLRADLSQSVVFQIHNYLFHEDYSDYMLIGVDKSRIVTIQSADKGLVPFTQEPDK
jgi:hypothetical protein